MSSFTVQSAQIRYLKNGVLFTLDSTLSSADLASWHSHRGAGAHRPLPSPIVDKIISTHYSLDYWIAPRPREKKDKFIEALLKPLVNVLRECSSTRVRAKYVVSHVPVYHLQRPTKYTVEPPDSHNRVRAFPRDRGSAKGQETLEDPEIKGKRIKEALMK